MQLLHRALRALALVPPFLGLLIQASITAQVCLPASEIAGELDTIFTSLRLWRDANHNGVSEPSELLSLQAVGLKTFELAYKTSKYVDEYGNRFRYRAKVKDSHNAQAGRCAWDVFLISQP